MGHGTHFRQPAVLTKHYNISILASTISNFSAGMSEGAVESALPAPHKELADDLFTYDGTGLVVDTMVGSCQSKLPEAPILVWAALLLADERLQDIVTSDLTTADGKLDAAAFSMTKLSAVTSAKVGGASSDKAASNILQWFHTAGIATPTRQGGSVIGIDEEHPTSFAVPKVLNFLEERLPDGISPIPGPDGITDLALGLGVNHWLNLTPADFRATAHRIGAPQQRHARSQRPAALTELDEELRRKGQAIIQGPPGVGKTYTVDQYVEWFGPPAAGNSRLTSIIASLPEHERKPELIADQIQTLGLPATWDVVQFHPSYSYERFVRGLQPTPVSGGVTFVPMNRMLGAMAEVGRELLDRGDDSELLLVLDEINRGDVAKVFGELLYALEYRGKPVSTPYAVEGDSTLIVPTNLFLLGTMNTADQSIAMVDKALRRRFAWITLYPDASVIDQASGFAGRGDREAAKLLFHEVAALFSGGGPELSRLQLGHSYFLPSKPHSTVGASIHGISSQFAYDAWPLLEEYEAEGLIDSADLDTFLESVGWTSSDRPQQQKALADAVASRLQSPQSPP